ncbi:MAG TPA: hypothetical protein VFO16_09340 [Pseudonocardiaceae bacterium]|nr:hypothetical protein [Pseudonocardiaceae bacterium]
MHMPLLMLILVLVAMLAAVSSVGNPPWWPWGLQASVILLSIIVLLILVGVKV